MLSAGIFAETVAERYQSDYLTLATTVPEFKVWADFGEHAATRTALARLADLLTQPTVRSETRVLGSPRSTVLSWTGR